MVNVVSYGVTRYEFYEFYEFYGSSGGQKLKQVAIMKRDFHSLVGTQAGGLCGLLSSLWLGGRRLRLHKGALRLHQGANSDCIRAHFFHRAVHW